MRNVTGSGRCIPVSMQSLLGQETSPEALSWSCRTTVEGWVVGAHLMSRSTRGFEPPPGLLIGRISSMRLMSGRQGCISQDLGDFARHERRLTGVGCLSSFFSAFSPTMSTSSGCPPTTGYNTVPAVGDRTWGGTWGDLPRLPLGMKRQSMLVSASRGEQLAKNRSPLQKHGIHPDPPSVSAMETRDWRSGPCRYTAAKSGGGGMRHGGGMITGVNGLSCFFLSCCFSKHHFCLCFFQVRGLGPRDGSLWS